MNARVLAVNNLSIKIEKINQADYISLTDIAKQARSQRPANVIQNWLKNTNTLRYLFTWEKVHNPNVKVIQMEDLLLKSTDNRIIISPQNYIDQLNAIGLVRKVGRGGGTFAHEEISLDFCYWLSPEFKVYFNKEFIRLKEVELGKQNLEWHIKKITDNIDEVRNLLDTVQEQDPMHNRLNYTLNDK